MDIIYLHGLRIETVIGIYDWERRVKQAVILDLDMTMDIRKAAASGNIADTLDYKKVAKRVAGYVGSTDFQLVETLAEGVAEIIMTEFNVGWVRLRVNKKGAVRGAVDVGVMIERGKQSP